MPNQIIACAVWTDANGRANAVIEFDTAVDVANLKIGLYRQPGATKPLVITDWSATPAAGTPATILSFEDRTGKVVLPPTGTVVFIGAKSAHGHRWELGVAVTVGTPTGVAGTRVLDVATSFDAL
ncbi:MAG TPA: hypothetical protein VNY33_02180, partial [Gaiellaceae bacterium]|nr:hypothetical protein [Gaiellaceae bacterium]